MAYKTGVSSTLGQLVDAIKSFAAENGFTVASDWGYSGYTCSAVSKNGRSYTFMENGADFYLNTAESLAGSGALQVQPGAAPRNCQVYPIAPPHVSYHMFCQGPRIHVAVELATNVYNHFSFGELEKNGNWVGGAYVTGGYYYLGGYSGNNYWAFQDWQTPPFGAGSSTSYVSSQNNCGHIRADVAGFNHVMLFQYTSSSDTYTDAITGRMSGNRLNNTLVFDEMAPNNYNGRALLMPIIADAAYSRGSSFPGYVQLGSIPDAAYTNIRNLNPKDVVNGDWMVFPVQEKNGPNNIGGFRNSGNIGVAYKL